MRTCALLTPLSLIGPHGPVRASVSTLLLVEIPGKLGFARDSWVFSLAWKNEARKTFALRYSLQFFFGNLYVFRVWVTKNGNIWRQGQHGRTFCGDRRLCFLDVDLHIASQTGPSTQKIVVFGRKATQIKMLTKALSPT